jgi:NAD+ diphosphatase
MEMNFCRRCGSELKNEVAGIYKCKNGHSLYSNPAPTVGVFFVTDDDNVLLSIRGREPNIGDLDSFGGFIDDNETAEAAAVRELEEELGLAPNQYEDLQFLCTAPSTYLYEGEDRTVLSIFFYSRLKPDVVPVAADDVAGIETLSLATITPDHIGADDVWQGLLKLKETIL